jgi:hypothetical protein
MACLRYRLKDEPPSVRTAQHVKQAQHVELQEDHILLASLSP